MHDVPNMARLDGINGHVPDGGNTSPSSRFIKVSACLGDLPIAHHAHQFRAIFKAALSLTFKRFDLLLLRFGLRLAFGHRVDAGSKHLLCTEVKLVGILGANERVR
jgi:hypothetical protein